MDVNGIHSVISINRLTLAKTAEEAIRATEVERHDDVPLKASTTGYEYVVERIVGYKDNHKGTRYLIRWYGYRSADDTWEPTHHIPQHLIRRH